MALITAQLNAGHSGGDSVAIRLPPFSLSLISLMVSVDVKHHVYLRVCLSKQVVNKRTIFSLLFLESAGRGR